MPSQRLLLLAAFLAPEGYACLSRSRRDAIGRAAFAAFRLDPRLALLDGDAFALQRFLDQAFGLVAHRLLRHVALSLLAWAVS